eukprot:CAMPEP_0197841250 /NCGR_PEP_ID=MMETSP1437-20131217/46069_1 /TAXON_ID=49252 ORGANISM="Eucampia antarctica, Strain CCMP1452" /NCGR_SAMPLE_ID=MMETSP1437 /ASSEMBLY_ACC=CAM_ASM_001096 /LENGTH=170 /DNA_ID=CAMNT_0043450975 /DNA_START=388 /DNA_END=900 /DNA_ORIENTATION=-
MARWPSFAFLLSPIVSKHSICTKGVESIFNSNRFQRLASAPLKSTVISSDKDGEVATLLDRNDVEFEVGCIVRVNSSNYKAHHVSKKGFGYFNEDKEFVLSLDVAERGKKCLSIPEGLRGAVTRVYDINTLGTNFPIRVKFIKGENDEEGYASPLTFTMHFEKNEVDVVV